jgi:hypothetical protein
MNVNRYFLMKWNAAFALPWAGAKSSSPLLPSLIFHSLADLFDLLVATFPYSALPGRVVLQAHQQRPLERSGEVLGLRKEAQDFAQ